MKSSCFAFFVLATTCAISFLADAKRARSDRLSRRMPYATYSQGLPRHVSSKGKTYDEYLGRYHPAFGSFGDLSHSDFMFYDPDANVCIGDVASIKCKDELPPCKCAPGMPSLEKPITVRVYRYAQKGDFEKFGLRNCNAGDLRWVTQTLPDACESNTIAHIAEDGVDGLYVGIYDVDIISGFGKEGASYGACNGGSCAVSEKDVYANQTRENDFIKIGWNRWLPNPDAFEGAIWLSFRGETAAQQQAWKASRRLEISVAELCAGAKNALGIDDMFEASESNLGDYLAYIIENP